MDDIRLKFDQEKRLQPELRTGKGEGPILVKRKRGGGKLNSALIEGGW